MYQQRIEKLISRSKEFTRQVNQHRRLNGFRYNDFFNDLDQYLVEKFSQRTEERVWKKKKKNIHERALSNFIKIERSII